MIYFKTEDFPDLVRKNFGDFCEWDNPLVSYDEYVKRRDALLAEFKGTRIFSNGFAVFTFPSEEYYTWFILRWS